MKQFEVTLKSTAPYSQSRQHESPKLDKERPDDYDVRTWRERLHVDESGMVYIPQMALKNCFFDAAQYLGMQIPGKGKSTYTKHFKAGVMITDPVPLGIKGSEVKFDRIQVPSDGVAGSGKRVAKHFPRIDSWEATFTVIVIDNVITETVLREHIKTAGLLIGIGRFRPRNGGFYGRFNLVDLKEI